MTVSVVVTVVGEYIRDKFGARWRYEGATGAYGGARGRVAVGVDDAAAEDCGLGVVMGDAVSSDDADGIDDVDGADDVPGIATAWFGAGVGDGHNAVGKISISWPTVPPCRACSAYSMGAT